MPSEPEPKKTSGREEEGMESESELERTSGGEENEGGTEGELEEVRFGVVASIESGSIGS